MLCYSLLKDWNQLKLTRGLGIPWYALLKVQDLGILGYRNQGIELGLSQNQQSLLLVKTNILKLRPIIDAAGASGVNILCCRWCEFAEPVNGESTQFLQEFALKYNMVIISSILERDINHGGTLWNTAVIIGNHGNIIDSLEYCSFLFKLGTSMEPIAFVDCNC
ncbi:hypothetical protein V6Z12_D01G160600 [Gossypium hirsutum]